MSIKDSSGFKTPLNDKNGHLEPESEESLRFDK